MSGLFSFFVDAPGFGVDGLRCLGFPFPRERCLKPLSCRWGVSGLLSHSPSFTGKGGLDLEPVMPVRCHIHGGCALS